MTSAALGKVVAVLRLPWVRVGFLLVAVGLAAVAVVTARDQLGQALDELSVGSLALALLLGAAQAWFSLLAWRSILADLGSGLPLAPAVTVFGVGQIGKYVPGGVWNVVATAELGADHRVPRARSLTAIAVATLVSLVSGCVVGAVALVASADGLGSWAWVGWVAPLTVVLLLPPVLNRIVAVGLRALRQPPPEHAVTARGMVAAVAWSVAGWAAAGLHLWVLATDLGLERSWKAVALCVGGYAAAWVVGLLVVVVPAGAGAREAALLLALGGSIAHGSVLLTVLVSRVLMTIVDLVLAGAGLAALRRHRRAHARAEAPDDAGAHEEAGG
jgi:hypothetical protein